MNLFRLLFSASPMSMIIACVSGLFSGISSAGLVALINYSLNNRNHVIENVNVGYLSLCVFLFIFTLASLSFTSKAAQESVSILRLHLSKQVLNCPLIQLEALGSSCLLASFLEDVEDIANSSLAVSQLCVNAALLFVCFMYLGSLSIALFLVFSIFVVIGISVNQFFGYQGRSYLAKARDVQGRLVHYINALIYGIKELKLNRLKRDMFVREDVKRTIDLVKINKIAASKLFAIGGSWGLVSLFIPIGALLFLIPRYYFPSSLIISYTVTFLFMITPIRVVINALPEIFKAEIALKKINELGLSLSTFQRSYGGNIEDTFNHQLDWKFLRFDEVIHEYDVDRRFILGPINITFKLGELVYITGGNGSGKSTFIKILTGLYTPDSGRIFLDSTVISDQNKDAYKQQFSVIFSDYYLFNRFLGLDAKYIDNHVNSYIELLCLGDYVCVNNGELSSSVSNLSQGQKKRLALLFAYLENRVVYVFDEWASDQDPEFKKVFYTKLLPELRNRGKLVISITHDDNYFQYANRIIKLQNGQIESDIVLQL
jgi:putative pyoverdin transport system ATP-binding/permease protein